MSETLNHTRAFPVHNQQLQHRLSDEESCLAFLFHKRWPDGFQCPYCRWQHPRSAPCRSLICSHCGHPSSITTNTVMHGTKKTLAQWLLAINWFSSSENETSAKNLQRLLNLSSYQTAWTWLQKLRMAMGTADNIPCQGLVELAYAPVRPAWEKPQQALVIAAAEIILPTGIIGKIRMSAIDRLDLETISHFLHAAVTPDSSIFGHELPVYKEVERQGYLYVYHSQVDNPHRAEQMIKGVEIWMNKVHRGGVTLKHLQPYLDEFCFRNNSAMLPSQEAVFNLLLQGVLANKPKPYRELVSTQIVTRRV